MIAASECVVLTNGHTDDWRSRAPNTTTAACPAALHTLVAPPADVRAIEFNQFGAGQSLNRTGMVTGLTFSKVANRNAFLQLYQDLPMYFNKDELQFIIGDIYQGAYVNGRKGTVGALDDIFKVREVTGTNEVLALSLAGRGQAQISKKEQLAISGSTGTNPMGDPSDFVASPQDRAVGGYDDTMIADFGGVAEINREIDGNRAIGKTLATIAKAFRAGAMTTATITLDSADWHSFDNPNSRDMATSHQGRWNIWLGNAIYGFLKTLERTDNPYRPGEKMIQSFLLSVSTEFTRTPVRTSAPAPVNTNNDDGGTQAFLFMGSKVRGGCYGNITGTGSLMGFNSTTGLVSSGDRPNEASIWKAHGDLMGVPVATLNSQVSTGSTIPILRRPGV